MSENMKIWDALKETDPNRTKKITGKKYKGDSINPNYIYEKLTKQFGPCGIGWCFEVQDETWQTGKNGDIVHSVRIGLWYELDGKRSALIPGYGGTTFSGNYSSGPYTDDDAAKKSLTDAITKASQLIGMSADIFGGDWDDSKYVAELKEKYGDNDSSTAPTNTNTTKTSSTEKKLTEDGEARVTKKQAGLLYYKFKDAGFSDAARDAYCLTNYKAQNQYYLPARAMKEIVEKAAAGQLNPVDRDNPDDDIPF